MWAVRHRLAEPRVLVKDGNRTDIYDMQAVLEPGNIAGTWRLQLVDAGTVTCVEAPLFAGYAELIGWQVQLECTWEQPGGDGWGDGWIAIFYPPVPA